MDSVKRHSSAPAKAEAPAVVSVVHVLASYELGGGEMVALHLAQAQKAAGMRVLVIGLAPGALLGKFLRAGIDACLVSKKRPKDLFLCARIARRMAAWRPNIVHTHDPQALCYAAAATQLMGAIAVHTKHGAGLDTPRRMWLQRLSTRVLDVLVCVSPQTNQTAVRTSEAPLGKLRVIENGIDTSRFHPDQEQRHEVRKLLGLEPQDFLIGTVGRLEAIKNYSLLLQAAAPLLGPHCKLAFVGDGSQAPLLKQLSQKLGCRSHVLFLGLQLEVAALLRAMDLFVLSSDSEGLPLALLEAMATGLPVVSTAAGGVPDVLDHKRSGLLVAPGNELALRLAMQEVREQPRFASSMGLHARAAVLKDYSLERMHERYFALYRRLLEEHHVLPPQGVA